MYFISYKLIHNRFILYFFSRDSPNLEITDLTDESIIYLLLVILLFFILFFYATKNYMTLSFINFGYL